MTTITIRREPRVAKDGPGVFKKGFGKIKSAFHMAGTVALTPHKASLKRLAEMPLTVVASGLFDWAGFHINGGIGLLITGVSLVILEHLISDDDTSRR